MLHTDPVDEFGAAATPRDEDIKAAIASPEFDAMTSLVADVLDCPIALITLFGRNGRRFEASFGLEEAEAGGDNPFCKYTIMTRGPMVVPDAREDERFSDSDCVTGSPGFVFYAGAPITITGDRTLGTVSVADTAPRTLSDRDMGRLLGFARAAAGLIDAFNNRQKADAAKRKEEEKSLELSRAASVLEQVTKMSGVGGWELILDPPAVVWTKETARIHEVPPDYEPNLDEGIEFYAPEARPVITKAVEDAIATGSGWDVELPLITATGKRIWVHSVGTPVFEGDAVTSVIGAFQDISERRKAEHRIRESEAAARKISEELRAILDNMGEGVSVFDGDANLVIWNQKYVEIFGKQPGEVQKGVPFIQLLENEKIRGDFKGDIDKHFRQLCEDLSRNETVVHRFRTAKGTIINSTHAPLPNGGWVGTHSDVTAQVRAAERARAVIRTAVDGIITIDEAGSILEFNPAAERLFGYSAEEIRGQKVKVLMPPEDAAHHDDYLANFNSPSGHRIIGKGRELIGVRKDGSSFPLELAVSAAEDDGRRTFTGILRDITERKQIDQMKDHFVSNVNHELRTPLTTIRGALGLLKATADNLLDESARRLLDVSVDGCDRLSSLVDDILDMEKIASGKMTYNLELVELSDAVRDIVARHVSYAELHQVSFQVRSAPEPIYARVDAGRFEQALVNLLSNAAKFSPPGGEVVFAVAPEGPDRVRIRVIDRGPGIPAEFAPKVFEKFAQADGSSTRHKGGSGLGLSIAREIIAAFDGSLDFVTAPGAGTTFWIELPRVEHPDAAGRIGHDG